MSEGFEEIKNTHGFTYGEHFVHPHPRKASLRELILYILTNDHSRKDIIKEAIMKISFL